MAIIKIDDKHQLRSDSRQWVFESLTNSFDKNGKQLYKPLRFYVTLESAVQGCYSYFVQTSDADGVIELMSESKRVLNKLVDVFSPKLEIKEKVA